MSLLLAIPCDLPWSWSSPGVCWGWVGSGSSCAAAIDAAGSADNPPPLFFFFLNLFPTSFPCFPTSEWGTKQRRARNNEVSGTMKALAHRCCPQSFFISAV